MGSKWLNNDAFKKFVSVKKEEQEQQPLGNRKSDIVWPSLQKGTKNSPIVYEVRLLPDPNNDFYLKYYYHMFKSGEKWVFLLCDKTFDFNNFCPWCAYSSHLWSGTENDKKLAPQYGRKERYVGNVYIIDDPRDAERPDDKKMNKTVKLYEFPAKLEAKIRKELLDTKNGYGMAIFDPDSDGRNLLITVGSTDKMKDGKEWPDYSLSEFARRASAIGSNESEIQAIMNSRHDISRYLKSMRKTREEHKELLQAELIWDTIESDWNKAFKIATDVQESPKEEDIPFEPDVPASTNEDVDQDDLLKELEGY